MDDLQELERGLRISKDDLDKELIRQPQTFYSVSKLFMSALAEKDSAELRSKQIEAEVDYELRKAASHSGEKKPTETQLKNQISAHIRVRKAKRRILAAQAASAQLDALRESYKLRSYALRDLVALYTSNYFSEDSGKSYERPRERTAHKGGT